MVSGRVVLVGTPPPPPGQPRGSDPFCARHKLVDDSLVVDAQGGVRSVLVRVLESAGGPYAPPTQPVMVTQLDCQYRPRVLGAVRGQPVLVKNADGTVHNVHALVGDATLLNQVQVDAEAPLIDLRPITAAPARQAGQPSLEAAPLHLRCDIHPWMSAYLWVLDHPFFAVTGDDGTFVIKNLPAGEYTLQAWHERLGTQNSKLSIPVLKTVPAGADSSSGSPIRVEFRFAASVAAAPLTR